MKLKIPYTLQNEAVLSQSVGNHPLTSLATFYKHVEKPYLGKTVSREHKVTVAEMKTYYWHCSVKYPFLCSVFLF